MKRSVRAVIDGDTFVVHRKICGSQYVRLADVNAPELNEVGGHRAKNALSKLIEGSVVAVLPVGQSLARIAYRKTYLYGVRS